jgi:hypothetical protein
MSTSRVSTREPRTTPPLTRGPKVPAPPVRPRPTRSRSVCPGWQLHGRRCRKPRGCPQPVPPRSLDRAGRTWDTVTFGGKSPTRAGVAEHICDPLMEPDPTPDG